MKVKFHNQNHCHISVIGTAYVQYFIRNARGEVDMGFTVYILETDIYVNLYLCLIFVNIR